MFLPIKLKYFCQDMPESKSYPVYFLWELLNAIKCWLSLSSIWESLLLYIFYYYFDAICADFVFRNSLHSWFHYLISAFRMDQLHYYHVHLATFAFKGASQLRLRGDWHSVFCLDNVLSSFQRRFQKYVLVSLNRSFLKLCIPYVFSRQPSPF